jgi:hypothetical protein
MSKRVQAILILSVLILCGLSFLLGPYGLQGRLLSSPSDTSSGTSFEQALEAKDVVYITPVDFFSGELKRLKGHLDFVSAVCFKIKTEGRVRCVPEAEVWCEGERVDRSNYGFKTDARSDEVSFTLRRIVNAKSDKVQYHATFGGIRSFDRILDEATPRRHLKVAFGPVSVEQKVELKRGDSVVVWAMGGGHGVDLSKPNEVENELKKLPWAMIVRLVAEPNRE